PSPPPTSPLSLHDALPISLADRETSTLSGGELQRLALAAALARRPSLLLSDESTAMVDRTGRRQLVALLRETAADGVGVVHVTRSEEHTSELQSPCNLVCR